MNLIEKEH